MQYRRSFFRIAVVVFILQAALICLVSLPWLLAKLLADDFFYYLVLARNYSLTGIYSFDGVQATNGFHPLYLFILTPLASLIGEHSVLFVKAALIILLFFHTAIGVVLFSGFSRLGRSDLGYIIGLLWLLNPWAMAISLHGVEAPISAFFWMLSIFLVLHYRMLTCRRRLLWAFLLGLLLGVAILARTDALLLLGAVLATEFLRAIRGKVLIRGLFELFLLSIGTFLITLPWWYWNWFNFGMFMQVSGKAVFLLAHGFDSFHPLAFLRRASFQSFMYVCFAITFSLVPLSVGTITLLKHAQKTKVQFWAIIQPKIVELDFVILALFFLAGWYGVWQWHIQRWYFLVTIACTTMFVGFVLMAVLSSPAEAWVRHTRKLTLQISIFLLVLFSLTQGYGYPRQIGAYWIADWLNQHSPEEAVIGSWNSGILGFLTKRRVINLDGVVNNSLYAYKVARKAETVESLNDYLRIRNIDYIADYDVPLPKDLSAIGFQPVYYSSQYGFTIFRRDGHSGQIKTTP